MSYKSPSGSSSGYGKRPLWQWIVIYLIVGAIVYGVIYYFWMGNKSGGYSSTGSAPQTTNYGQ